MYPALQLGKSANSADKVNALVCLRILNAQNRLQNLLLQNGYIQTLHRITVLIFRLQGQQIPFVLQEQSHLSFPLRMLCLVQLLHIKDLFDPA